MSRAQSRQTLALVFLLSIGVIPQPSFSSGPPKSGALPDKLILAIDGISWQALVRAKNAGLFSEFHAPSKMVAPFPSMSDPAWADIFQTARPEWVQRLHYNPVLNKRRGGPFSDLKTQREWERRLHYGDTGPLHHFKTYFSAFKVALSELKSLRKKFFRARGIKTFFAYTASSDSFAHTSSGTLEYLKALDTWIQGMQKVYRMSQNGRALEILLISDHGNNEIHGQRLRLKKHLELKGWEAGSRIKDAKDIVIPRAGVVHFAQIFSHPHQKEPLALASVEMEGVDLALFNRKSADGDEEVVVLKKTGSFISRALITRNGNLYSYSPVNQGDPLNILPGVVFPKGKRPAAITFSEGEWFARSKNSHYPHGVVRSWRAFHDVVQFPGDVILSLKDGWAIPNPLIAKVKKVEKMDGGTHGSLHASTSLGFILSNLNPTPDLPSNLVRAALISEKLPIFPLNKKWMRIVEGELRFSLPKNHEKGKLELLIFKNQRRALRIMVPGAGNDGLVRIPLTGIQGYLPDKKILKLELILDTSKSKSSIVRAGYPPVVSRENPDRKVVAKNRIFRNGQKLTLLDR